MTYLILFYEFFKVGLFSIGGGMATIPFLFNLADKYPWFTRDLLSYMIAVSESTPGPIGVNMATYAGNQAGGVLGGIVSTFGLVCPAIIIIIIVSKILQAFKDNKYVNFAFYGMRPIVTGMIFGVGLGLVANILLKLSVFNETGKFISLIDYKKAILFVVFFFLVNKFKIHPIIFIVIAGILGVLFSL